MGHEIIVNVIPALTSLLVLATQAPSTQSAQFGLSTSNEPNNMQYVWKVKAGETLEDIALRYYGSKEYWTQLWNDNPWIEDPNHVEEGWKLHLRKNSSNENEQLTFDLTEKILSKKPVEKNANLSKLPISNFIAKAAPTPTQGQSFITPPFVTQAQTQPRPTMQPQQQTGSSFDDVYRKAGEKYGVPWEILYGIHLTETGLRDGEIYNSQGSGAQGPMQFMPGTFQAYAVDGDGDGKANINDAKDAIFTAANYIAKHGSVGNALASYGGNISGTLAAARSRGYNQ